MPTAPKTKPAAPAKRPSIDTGASIRPGKIVHYTLGAEPVFFPPKADFPTGGRFHIRIAAGTPVLLRTDLDGPSWPLDPGPHDITVEQPDEILLSGAGAIVRVMQQKEKA